MEYLGKTNSENTSLLDDSSIKEPAKKQSSQILGMLINLQEQIESQSEEDGNKLAKIIGEFSVFASQLDQKPAVAEEYTPEPQHQAAPEGYLCLSELSNSLQISKGVIGLAARLCNDELGEATIYHFQHGPDQGYSPEQQDIIKNTIESKIWIPEGYMTGHSIAQLYGVNYPRVQTAIKRINKYEDIGIEPIYRISNKKLCAFFSPQDQLRIEKAIEYIDNPPEGYLSITDLSHKLGVNYDRFLSVVGQIPANILGPVIQFMNEFGIGGPSNYYSPEQQEIISSYYTNKYSKE